MNVQDKIATYYSNARELIKQNNPKAARAYVLAILNYAVETYDHAKTILMKAKTQAFLDKWIAVSRELHTKGTVAELRQNNTSGGNISVVTKWVRNLMVGATHTIEGKDYFTEICIAFVNLRKQDWFVKHCCRWLWLEDDKYGNEYEEDLLEKESR